MEHIPVLAEKTVEMLQVRPAGTYVDATVGLGGHSRRILERLGQGGRLIAFDRDKEALEEARRRLGGLFPNVHFVHENFKNLPLVLAHLEVASIDGCLIDLGASSLHFDSPRRGFSFRLEGPLDMRMDARQKTTAADLVNTLPPERLAAIFRRFGQERAARRIAQAIVEARRQEPFRTTAQLASLIERVKGRGRRRIHPATQVFQALRIEVNQELSGLEELLREVIHRLAPRGRLVVLTFHSLEDRIVKQTFRTEAGQCICFRPEHLCTCPRIEEVRLLTRRPVKPAPEEIESNPRARSAKLRAVERLETPVDHRGPEHPRGKEEDDPSPTLLGTEAGPWFPWTVGC